MYIFGTDEAGYGPNLGPLVVSGCCWEVPDDLAAGDFYAALFPAVLPWSKRADLSGAPGRFLLDDSKKLYQGRLSSGGLKRLEYALLACLTCLDEIESNAITFESLYIFLTNNSSLADKSSKVSENAIALPGLDFCESADAANGSEAASPVWEIPAKSLALPIDADLETLKACADGLRTLQDQTGIQVCELASDVVQPQRFNRLCRKWGNKSTLLSHVTLELLFGIMSKRSGEPGIILCDKHGGRDRYVNLLEDQFETDIEILRESRAISEYRFSWRGAPYQISFQAKCDSQPPAALASVADKYLRELFMIQFNDFWQNHIPRLQPTAGYPVDARRFLDQIEEKRKELGVPLDILWRER